MYALSELKERDDRPREDHIVVLSGATWADYQRLLEVRGDKSAPRITYLEGRLQIMSPSEDHENVKSLIGCLIEVYCLENDIEFRKLGSWTLEDKAADRGAEPDECYVFREFASAKRPDLVIEVVWTSGGIRKLDVYKKLGVREVWYWRRGKITPYLLSNAEYVEAARSDALPGIDLEQLGSFLDRPTTSAAIRDYRAALQG
jgi:Uma2 family endonuclease